MSSQITKFVILVALATCCSASVPGNAIESGTVKDNSGRRLAVAVPIAPATGVGSSVVPGNFAGLRQTVAPVRLSPEVENALEQGSKLAVMVKDVVLKRAADSIVWGGMLWRQLQELPRLSSARDYGTSPFTGQMQALSEKSNGHQLYFTSERRLKIVAGQ